MLRLKLSRENFAKLAGHLLEVLGSERVAIATILTLAFIVALLSRLTPMHWGVYLNEFDPFYEYYLAEKMLEEGGGNLLGAIAWWYRWWFEDPKPRDTLFWAPYGRDLRASSQPGAAIFTLIMYFALKAIGVDASLYFVHAISVPLGAATAVFAAYLLGREIKDSRVGVLSALMLALSWAYAYRTNFGAKHEGFAIPFMLLAFYLFLSGYRRGSLTRAALAGLSMGGVVLSWGAYLYPWNLLALVTLAWLPIHWSDTKLAKMFLVTNAITTLFVATTPRFGPTAAFFSITGALPLAATILSVLALLGAGYSAVLRVDMRKLALGIAVALILFAVIGTATGILARIAGRMVAVLVPLVREPGVTTVAEHTVTTWSSMFDDFQTALLFGIAGMYLCFLKAKERFSELFSALYFATSVYFSASIVRLLLLLSPAVAVIGAKGLIEILDKASETVEAREARKRGETSPGWFLLVAVIVLLVFSPSILASKIPLYSHQPPLILSSSVPVVRYNYEYMDWLSALEWIKLNIPRDATIATWWDYGYWISVNTERKTTCDNATIDTKQIQRIAKAFMSDEETALEIFRELNVTYVVVFEPLQSIQIYPGVNVYFSMIHPALGGDMAKSPQMLRWIGLSASDYIYGYRNGTYATLTDPQGYTVYLLLPENNPKALNATLYKMIFARNFKQQLFIFDSFVASQLQGYKGPILSIPPLRNFELVYVSEPNGWVKIFKVKS
ncbi:MAG: STT3 domain-containing protein [Thermofilum sp.]